MAFTLLCFAAGSLLCLNVPSPPWLLISSSPHSTSRQQKEATQEQTSNCAQQKRDRSLDIVRSHRLCPTSRKNKTERLVFGQRDVVDSGLRRRSTTMQLQPTIWRPTERVNMTVVTSYTVSLRPSCRTFGPLWTSCRKLVCNNFLMMEPALLWQPLPSWTHLLRQPAVWLRSCIRSAGTHWLFRQRDSRAALFLFFWRNSTAPEDVLPKNPARKLEKSES